MRFMQIGMVGTAMCLFLTSVALFAEKAADDLIPAEKITQLQSEPARPDKNLTPEQTKEYYQKFLTQRLAEADAVIAEYPNAKNVSQAKVIKLTASFMLSQNDQAAYDKYRDEILKTAQEIEADPAADRENKMLAIMYRYRTQIHPIENESELHVLFDKMIGEMKKGYKAAANVQEKYDDKMGYLLAIRISLDKNKPELAKAYVKKALVEFPDNERFLRIQKMLDKPMFSGKPFEAELTLLDGKKLKLPDDMKGKVVVVDFWASWCGPCRQFAKELKKFYDKYNGKGVEVIGINIDTDKGDMESYLKEHPDYTWKQSYTGQGWEDPTAQKYGINAIPSVWVIGKDGNIVSDNARGDLEGIVEKALNADVK